MHAPQLIVVAWFGCELGVHLARDGEAKKGNYNFVSTAIAYCLLCGLLWWGGFFH